MSVSEPESFKGDFEDPLYQARVESCQADIELFVAIDSFVAEFEDTGETNDELLANHYSEAVEKFEAALNTMFAEPLSDLAKTSYVADLLQENEQVRVSYFKRIKQHDDFIDRPNRYDEFHSKITQLFQEGEESEVLKQQLMSGYAKEMNTDIVVLFESIDKDLADYFRERVDGTPISRPTEADLVNTVPSRHAKTEYNAPLDRADRLLGKHTLDVAKISLGVFIGTILAEKF
jgi:hypothetical protein